MKLRSRLKEIGLAVAFVSGLGASTDALGQTYDVPLEENVEADSVSPVPEDLGVATDVVVNVDSVRDRAFTAALGLVYKRDAVVSPVHQGPAFDASIGYGFDGLHLGFSGSNKGGSGFMLFDRVGVWAGYEFGDGDLTIMPEFGGGAAFERGTVIGTTWYVDAGVVAKYAGFKQEDLSLWLNLDFGIDRDAKDYPFWHDAMRSWLVVGLGGEFKFGQSTTIKAEKTSRRDRSDRRLVKNEDSDVLASAKDVVAEVDEYEDTAVDVEEFVDTAEPDVIDEAVEEIEESGFKVLEGVEYFSVGSTEDGDISLPDYVDLAYEKREKSSLPAKQGAELASFDLKIAEMRKYAAGNSKAAERAYMDIQDLNMEDLWIFVDRERLFEYYFVGAQSIRATGDIEEVYVRLQFALQIKPDSREVLNWMNELETKWFGVSFKGLDLNIENGFFAADARAALDFANESLAEEGSFDGYLPMPENYPYVVTERGRRGVECVLPELPSDL